MRVLITGITGFTGSHLADYCVEKGYEVFGLTRGRYHQYTFIEHLKDKIELIEGDLSDIHSIRRCMETVYPDKIFHLGAMTSVPLSWSAPKTTIDTNTLGTLNLLESVRTYGDDPEILIVGTSEEYGLVHPDEAPIKETNPLRPLSPYGVSKIASDLLGYQYHRSYGLKCVRVRPFNIVGPRGGQEIVTANFAIQIINIEKGHKNHMEVGNLKSIRDFNDVRDTVRAYDVALKMCDFGEVYNICTGKGITINQLLLRMLDLTGQTAEIYEAHERMRPSDVENLIGDSTKFRKKTGWEPEIPLDESLMDVLSYWREQ